MGGSNRGEDEDEDEKRKEKGKEKEEKKKDEDEKRKEKGKEKEEKKCGGGESRPLDTGESLARTSKAFGGRSALTKKTNRDGAARLLQPTPTSRRNPSCPRGEKEKRGDGESQSLDAKRKEGLASEVRGEKITVDP